jgi:hypothetical protein
MKAWQLSGVKLPEGLNEPLNFKSKWGLVELAPPRKIYE